MLKFKNTPADIQAIINEFWNSNFAGDINKIGHKIQSIRYVDSIGNPKCIDIVNIAVDLLKAHNMDVDPDVDVDEVNIELHNYYTNGSEIYSQFVEHCDNDAHKIPVNTCIFYLRKDATISGGNLIIHNSILNIKSNTYALMTGELIHEIEPITGVGNRQCIVIQIPKRYAD